MRISYLPCPVGEAKHFLARCTIMSFLLHAFKKFIGSWLHIEWLPWTWLHQPILDLADSVVPNSRRCALLRLLGAVWPQSSYFPEERGSYGSLLYPEHESHTAETLVGYSEKTPITDWCAHWRGVEHVFVASALSWLLGGRRYDLSITISHSLWAQYQSDEKNKK